jgi:hypothetical protein
LQSASLPTIIKRYEWSVQNLLFPYIYGTFASSIVKRQTMAILFEWYETPVPNNETDETEKTTIHARITLNGKVGTTKSAEKYRNAAR